MRVGARDAFYVSIIILLLLINIAQYFNISSLLSAYDDLSREYTMLSERYQELMGYVADLQRLNPEVVETAEGWMVNWWIVGVAYVDGDVRGAVLPFTMKLLPGAGRIFINIDTPVGIDMQESLLIARELVRRSGLVDVDLDRYDIYLEIRGGGLAAAVEGPSAGLAMAIALVAIGLGDLSLEGVCATGALNIYGMVEKVGAVLEKSIACAEAGAEMIIVPSGQSKVVEYIDRVVEILPGLAMTIRQPVEVDVEERLREMGYSAEVVEVSTLEEAVSLLRNR